jgi:enterochelin esterase-like enzyme
MTTARARRVLGRLVVALGAMAFLAVGIGGVVRYVGTYWTYRGFAPPQHLATVTVGTGKAARTYEVHPGSVLTEALVTSELGGYRDKVLVYLPPGYAASHRRYPVLYLLHGFPGSAQNFINVGGVATLSDDLIAERRIAPMIIVMPNGARNFFQDEEWANTVQPGNLWESFVALRLVPYVDHRFRTLATGAERGIGGDSEGAYGGLNIAFHHVGEFDLVEGWSAYYNADRNPKMFGSNPTLMAYNSPGNLIAKIAPSLRANHVYLWLYGGRIDYTDKGSILFAQSAARLHVAYAFAVHPGRHNWHLWRSEMPVSLITASEYFTHGVPAA